MTVDALIARMTQDAHSRIAALRADADAQVATLADALAQASSRDLEHELASRQAVRRAALDAELAAARRRAATRLLTAQHAFLDRVFASAAALAADSGTDPRYLEALPRRVAAVAGHLGDRPAALRCRSELAPHLQRLLAGRPQLELEVDDTLAAGFVAATRDASCTIDCTLPAQLASLRPRLEAALLARVPR
jgi:vacuolar-type H+-ATPase subunit E/Vma4